MPFRSLSSMQSAICSPPTAMKLVNLFKESDAQPAPWPACFTGARMENQNVAMSWTRALHDGGYGGILRWYRLVDVVRFDKSVHVDKLVRSMARMLR